MLRLTNKDGWFSFPFTPLWLTVRTSRTSSKKGPAQRRQEKKMLQSLYRHIAPAVLLLAAFALQANSQIFVYNQDDGTGAMTTLVPPQAPITDYVNAYGPAWTIVTPVGGGLLFYSAQSGLGATNYVDQSGNLYTESVLSFGPGWTHIVQSGYFLLFYNSNSGQAVAGHMADGNFVPYQSVTSFLPGWTHIVATDQGSLLFYNAADGSGAVGYLNPLYAGDPGSFGQIVDAQYIQKKSYVPGYFITGWTQVLESHHGILLYRASDGLNTMVNVDPNTGVVSTLVYSVQNLTPGWTSIVAQPDSILFYNSATGDIATGHVLDDWRYSFQLRGKLAIDQLFPGYFSPGWTNAAYAPWPSPPDCCG